MTKRATKKKKTHVVETVVAAVAESGGAASTEHAERVEEETVQQVRQRLRAERERAKQEARIARINLREAFSQRSVSGLLDLAVDLSMESSRLRAEIGELANSRTAGGEKAWRSKEAYVEALATELESQRARCGELQAELERYGQDRHRWNNELSSQIGEALALKNAEMDLEKRRYADLFAVEKNRRERLELNLVTLLESLQVVGIVGVAGAGVAGVGVSTAAPRHNSAAQME